MELAAIVAVVNGIVVVVVVAVKVVVAIVVVTIFSVILCFSRSIVDCMRARQLRTVSCNAVEIEYI